MKLFHGSNLVVKEPKILSNVRALDFGAGFYLTSDCEQAKKWAILTTKRRNAGVATVTEYNARNKFISKRQLFQRRSIEKIVASKIKRSIHL